VRERESEREREREIKRARNGGANGTLSEPFDLGRYK
jgi:hypothetical protein